MERKTYTIKQTADALGVHQDTIRRWIAKGVLDATKVMGRVLIFAYSVDAALEGNRV